MLLHFHVDCIVSGMLKVEKNSWCPMAEQAISLIYRLAEHPDVICADIIKKQAAALLPPKPEASGGSCFDISNFVYCINCEVIDNCIFS